MAIRQNTVTAATKLMAIRQNIATAATKLMAIRQYIVTAAKCRHPNINKCDEMQEYICNNFAS